NRLMLLNLAAVYTTGFECPDPDRVIPEIYSMLADVKNIYLYYNQSFSSYPVTKDYLDLFDRMIQFVNDQPKKTTDFDHFTFIKDYVNPLYAKNQEMIVNYQVVS